MPIVEPNCGTPRVLFRPDDGDDEYFPESSERNPDAGMTLIVDDLPVAHLFTRYPSRMKSASLRRLATLLDASRPVGDPVTVLHAGAGALTLARHIAATRPDSIQVAIDDRAEVTEVVLAQYPLPQDAQLTVIRGNLSSALDTVAQWAWYDYVVIDLQASPLMLDAAPRADAVHNDYHTPRLAHLFADCSPLLGTTGNLAVLLPCHLTDEFVHTVADAMVVAGLDVALLSGKEPATGAVVALGKARTRRRLGPIEEAAFGRLGPRTTVTLYPTEITI
ncbi:polyamine aminopropyltransferase [Subtercola endophyticus]|uniref:hypothetical protein n=1 Tax=Subtercola endophyticus TaxID=2895559 RepID=UPI001E36B93D|nr:hypothetical protein [Subtercola endophyticus]UFS59297.1 hypothetical protein LQ955_00390 [Subtercola endophyticus]